MQGACFKARFRVFPRCWLVVLLLLLGVGVAGAWLGTQTEPRYLGKTASQ